ncbi:MAG: hypothetical protein IKJ73_10950 [Lachnospiraceae bacterium]|nr:hypothetical protein [Lachnospiraceae bacterium]
MTDTTVVNERHESINELKDRLEKIELSIIVNGTLSEEEVELLLDRV